MVYKITSTQRSRAKKIGVTIKASKLKGKKIAVFKNKKQRALRSLISAVDYIRYGTRKLGLKKAVGRITLIKFFGKV